MRNRSKVEGELRTAAEIGCALQAEMYIDYLFFFGTSPTHLPFAISQPKLSEGQGALP